LTPNEASPSRCDPSNFKCVTLGGDSARFADQSAILEGRYPIAVPSGAGAKTAHASFLLKAGHAQRLGAGALREMLGEGRPDHVSEGLHSEFQHVWSSGLHTSVGFGRRQSNNAKKHVYAVGRRVTLLAENTDLRGRENDSLSLTPRSVTDLKVAVGETHTCERADYTTCGTYTTNCLSVNRGFVAVHSFSQCPDRPPA